MKRKRVLCLCWGVILLCVFVLAVSGCDSLKPESGSSTPSEENQDQSAAVGWSMDLSCVECHMVQEQSFSDSSCLASLHIANSQCISCHADEPGLVKVHERATTPEEADVTRLKKTAVEDDTCLACHNSYVELAGKTKNSTVLTDSKGTTVNPHDIPENVEHGDIGCMSCHSMHEAKSAEVGATNLCTSCHHDNVYECFTCHI